MVHGLYHRGRHCRIGYAAGTDEHHLVRLGNGPCLVPEYSWEGDGVMNPCVLWDERAEVFRMWYAAGETSEPCAICHAESDDGFTWRKRRVNPVFAADPSYPWEQDLEHGPGTYTRVRGGTTWTKQ